MSNPEIVILQDQSVTITTTRAVLNGTTYAMANVTSVRHIKEPTQAGCLMLIALCIFMAGAFMIMNDISFGWILLAGGALALLIAWLIRKPKFWVRIGTAGAESNALWSYDPVWTNRVVAAINTAIVARG